MHPRRTAAALLVGATVMFALAVGVWFHNATVEVGATDLGERGPAGRVGCVIAPWDGGLHGNHGPGGEHSAAFYDEVAAKCSATNRVRFDAGIGSGVIAAVLFCLGVAATSRARGRSSG